MLVGQLFEAKENKLEVAKLLHNLGDLSPVLSKKRQCRLSITMF